MIVQENKRGMRLRPGIFPYEPAVEANADLRSLGNIDHEENRMTNTAENKDLENAQLRVQLAQTRQQLAETQNALLQAQSQLVQRSHAEAVAELDEAKKHLASIQPEPAE